jgi:prolipoprotein diacylglyceryltransferase
MCVAEIVLICIPTAVIGQGLGVAIMKVPAFGDAAQIIFRLESISWAFCNITIAAIYVVLLLKNWRKDAREPHVRKMFIHAMCSAILLTILDGSRVVAVFFNWRYVQEPLIVRTSEPFSTEFSTHSI